MGYCIFRKLGSLEGHTLSESLQNLAGEEPVGGGDHLGGYLWIPQRGSKD